MSSAIEDRIVAMKFDNKQFEPAAKTTMSTLDRLKQALNFTGSNKGLNDLQGAANRFSLRGLLDSVGQVGSKFTAMSAVAITAIANITNRAINAGLNIVKAFTFDPLKSGFQEYETQLNSVQTILANTQASGATLDDVNAALNQLNKYADKTIYNFGEMARNIGTFTAAGVGLDKSVAAIKGIANLAALSGSSSQQASTAMYQLSQAISAGRVSLQDWNSVVNAGMGGTVFQRALAMNAEKMGTLEKGAVKFHGAMKNVTIEGKSFRESITAKPGEKSWLTSDVLTRTLAQFTGDLSDAELAAQGFNKAEIKAIQQMAKTAQQAATEVKTFSGLMDTLKESAGSGWSQTFQILVGDFKESKRLWTDISNVVGGALNNSANARNKMLQDWKDLGGRKALIEGLRNVFAGLVAVIKPIREAFRDIFPATTGKQLFALTKNFLEFTKKLKVGADTAKNIRRTFAGVFAIFDIGWQAIKAIAGAFGDLFGLIGSKSGSFLEVTAKIGDFLVALDKAIKKGQIFQKVIKVIERVVASAFDILKVFGLAIKGLFTGFDQGISEGIASTLKRIGQRLAPLASLGDKVAAVWDKLGGVFKRIGSIFAPVAGIISQALSGIGNAIAKAFKDGDFNSVYDALNTGLLTGIVLLIKKFLSNGIKFDIGDGLFGNIKESFGALTETLKAMQTQIQAKTLLLIAAAVAVLTASIVTLSLIDSKKLAKSLTAIGVAFGELMVAMAILTKISSSAGFLKIPFIAGSMILLAGAVLILSAAVKNLSDLSWEDLVKGLGGVAALLLMLVGTAKGLDKSSGAIARAGLAMIPMAVGIKILASAVKDFSDLSWGDMARGLVAMAASLLIIAGAVALMPPTMILQAAGLILLSIALIGIGKALENMGGMKWGEIAKAMTVLAGSLILLAAGMLVMVEGLPGAAALLVAAAALVVLVPALKAFASLSWEEIGKAMVTLAGSLIILAAGLMLMTATSMGSAALMVAAVALGLLAPVLVILGAMSWESIGKGLVAIAGALLTLGLTSAILTPFIPLILLLSVALLALGLSMSLIGVGALALATAFSIFVAAGSAGIAVLTGMINLIPQFLTKFAEGIIGFATTIASQADKFTKAFVSLLNSLLDAIIQITPKLGRLLNVMIATGLTVLINNAPKLAAAGLKLLMAFLNEISKNIGKIVKVVADLIVKFLQALSANQQRVLTAGAKFIIKFINGLASTIRDNQDAMNTAGKNLANAIINGMTGGLWDRVRDVASAAASVAKRALDAAKSALGINSPSKEFFKVGNWSVEGMVLGFDKNGDKVVSAATDVAENSLSAVKKTLIRMSDILPAIDANPTITPVLDLARLTQDASKIGSLLGQKPLSANVSLNQASNISDNEINRSDIDPGAGGDIIYQYNQEINSPTPLSTYDIYRESKGLLSRKQEGIGLTP